MMNPISIHIEGYLITDLYCKLVLILLAQVESLTFFKTNTNNLVRILKTVQNIGRSLTRIQIGDEVSLYVNRPEDMCGGTKFSSSILNYYQPGLWPGLRLEACGLYELFFAPHPWLRYSSIISDA